MKIRRNTGPRLIGQVAATAILAAVWSLPAGAESLRDALASAYQSNPELRAARAQQRAVDENIARANSGFLPDVTASGNINRQRRESDEISGLAEGVDLNGDGNIDAGDLIPASTTTSTNKAYQARADQSLFRGFRDFNARREARSTVKAGRAQLLTTEQRVLLDAVTAYTNVLRDQAVLELRENNVQVLMRQLQASQDRFRVGEITRTDVAQSEARLAGAVSGRIRAEADLAASRANYERVIGQAPATLEDAPAMPPVPPTLDDAWSIALENNPAVRAARHNERAAKYAVQGAKGAVLPRLDGFAIISRNEGESFFAGRSVPVGTTTRVIGAQLTVPLYQGGAEYSDIRRAKQTASQRRLEILGAERQVTEQVRIAWEEYRAAQAQIESSSSQVRANEIALDGVRQEAAVGSRTTLDVLDAEQELLDSRVNLVRSQRNEYVAGFSLLAAVGHLNAAILDLPVELYDPEANYKSVRYKFLGWGTKGE